MKRSLRFQIPAFTAVRTVLNTMHRMVYPFLPVFGRGLGVDLQSMSYALTVRSVAGAFGPFLASVADSRGRKAGMIFGTLLFTLGVSIVVFWPVFPVFVLSLVLTTLGKYTFDPSMQAYLGDRVPYQRRGLAVAISELGWSFAFIIGVPLMGLLISRAGWMAPFSLLALLGLLSTAGLAWMLPRDPIPDANRPGLWRNLRTVFTYLPALAGLSLGLTCSAANEVINLVFGVWMEEAFGLKIAALGASAAIIGLSELGGESLVGFLTDRLGKIRAVAIGLVLNSLAALALPLLGHSLPGALVGLFLFYLTFEFTVVSSIPMMTEVLPAARATMMAANIAAFSLGRAAGSLLAPSLYSWGILASASAAVLLNLLALLALGGVRKAIGK